nr:RHS repeat domain-containing protein [Wenjunlia vitaminophila]
MEETDTWHYTWNTHNHLTDVVTPDGTQWHYTYDPLGRRTTKQRLNPHTPPPNTAPSRDVSPGRHHPHRQTTNHTPPHPTPHTPTPHRPPPDLSRHLTEHTAALTQTERITDTTHHHHHRQRF